MVKSTLMSGSAKLLTAAFRRRATAMPVDATSTLAADRWLISPLAASMASMTALTWSRTRDSGTGTVMQAAVSTATVTLPRFLRAPRIRAVREYRVVTVGCTCIEPDRSTARPLSLTATPHVPGDVTDQRSVTGGPNGPAGGG